jgi:general secretion pathway protein C
MNDRPNKSRRLAAVLLGCVVLIAMAVVIVRGLGSTPLPPAEKPEAIPIQERASAPVVSEPALEPDPPPAQPARIPAEAPKSIPLTGLPLRLLATLTQEESRLSLAQIEDIQHASQQLLKEGQVLKERPHVTLVRVEPNSVLLDNYGVQERLMLDPDGRRLSVDTILGGDETRKVELSEEERERRRQLSERLRAITDAGADYQPVLEMGGLLDDAVVRPRYDEQGEMTGIKLSEIRPGSVYEKVGIREGDVLTSVNGVAVGSPQAAAELLAQLASSRPLEVAVERSDGTEEVVSVSMEELLQDLEPMP